MKKQPKAYVILVCITVIAFVAGNFTVGRAYALLAPYIVFGVERTRAEHIKLIDWTRSYVRFSHEPNKKLPTETLRSLNVSAGIARVVMVAAVFCILVWLALSILARRHPNLSAELRRMLALK